MQNSSHDNQSGLFWFPLETEAQLLEAPIQLFEAKTQQSGKSWLAW